MRPNFNIAILAVILRHLEDKKFSFKNISGIEDNIFSIEVTEPGGETYTGVYGVEGEEVKEVERKPKAE